MAPCFPFDRQRHGWVSSDSGPRFAMGVEPYVTGGDTPVVYPRKTGYISSNIVMSDWGKKTTCDENPKDNGHPNTIAPVP